MNPPNCSPEKQDPRLIDIRLFSFVFFIAMSETAAAVSDASPMASTMMARHGAERTKNDSNARTIRSELQRLQNNDATLTSLRVPSGGLDKRLMQKQKKKKGETFIAKTAEDWSNLGEAIATNTNLRHLELLNFSERHDNSTPFSLWYDDMTSQKHFIEQLNRNRSICRLVLNSVDPRDGTLFTHALADLFFKNLNLASLSITGVEVTDNLCTVMGRM